MLPVEILINEHRLIMHAIGVLRKEQEKLAGSGRVDSNFIVTSVDFFRTYADRYHHGKEEGILFNGLYRRKISEADGTMMRELILEHATARKTVTSLDKLKTNYVGGDTASLDGIMEALKALIELYPRHIEKEDKRFFFPVMRYFSEAEQREMLRRFQEYDQNFTDNRFRQIIETLEKDL